MNDLQLLHDFEELQPRNEPTRRPIVDPLADYCDEEFRKRYRMKKDSFEALLELILSELGRPSDRGKPIEQSMQLLIALRYFADGSLQLKNGDAVGVPQQTTSDIIARVARAIAKLAKDFIKPPTKDEANQTSIEFVYMVRDRFQNAKQLHGVIGAIDGTQIPVLAAGVPNRELYRNRKGIIAINVQAICDAKMRFWDVVARWPGSVHDSRIFANCKICAMFEAKQLPDGWLIGDSGYPSRQFLLTPISNPKSKPERDFNFTHAQQRNVIERAFGVLKKRFACLAAPMRQDMKNVLPTVIACFVLHNFLIMRKDLEEADDPEDAIGQLAEANAVLEIIGTEDGQALRRSIVSRFFT